jgi:hypothetical protein
MAILLGFSVVFRFCYFTAFSPAPHRILGDDVDGPHSSAIIIGRRTVLACAHSLGLVVDEEIRGKTRYKYLEDYWIQPSLTKNVRGEFTTDNRVPLKLFKFHVHNDWALFVRADNKCFAPEEVASIDRSPLETEAFGLAFADAVVMHCPVALKSGIRKARKFTINCNSKTVQIQGQSYHHIKYQGSDLCRGSAGGGVYLRYSTSVIGMHIEAINEAEYDADEDAEKLIAHTDKRVSSEDDPYEPIESSSSPPAKKLKVDSEAIASLAGGNNGMGSALIICKFPRLLHYIDELES